ncbi:hypothetical protein ACFXDO_24255 [Streptomyces nigra]|uniref:hypothetical protein n=1 Tax=Streptomyces nigra TaxID=1827580 RepID=UPI0036C46D0B
MDLRSLLRRKAMSHPSVLAVTVPGATELRLELEAEVCRRGWPLAGAPAAADLLVVCGFPAPQDAQWLDAVERSMPEPAVRIRVQQGGQVADALDTARRELIARALDPHRAEEQEPGNRADAGHEGHHDEHGPGAHHDTSRSDTSGDQGSHGHHGMDHHHGDQAPESGHEDHADHEPADRAAHVDRMDHQGHGGAMAHVGHDMHAMGDVAGLRMAERGDDRDRLRLDQLHVPLGPALADWPTGLILRLTLQGDVVQGVEVDHLSVPFGDRLPFWDEPWLRAARGEEVSRGTAARRRCAAHLDGAGRLLAVVGWDDVAARCRRLRDELLSGAPSEAIRGALRKTVRRVGKSRSLRWSLAGLGALPADRAQAAGVTGPALAADGDACDRLLTWLTEIERGQEELDDIRPVAWDDRTGPRGRLDGPKAPSQALLDVLPELLTGAEFACARIILASLDPDIEELAPVSGAAHA